jgi:YidC/Oxa1 family membrane protein insertase
LQSSTGEPYYHYLLYHYAQVGDERPLDSLAKKLWKVESVKDKPDDEVHEVVFSSPEVPGLDVKIFKTYTLKRRTYHFGLEVKIQNRRSDKQEFRYQIAGARGLPIEGEWYTSTFRNALVGWVEDKRAYRHVEDARQLGEWAGGDKLERGDSKVIRYAAVAVQYFASALVVDVKENQPSKKDNFLERVRATVENQWDVKGQRPAPPYHEDIVVRATTEPIVLEANGKPGDSIEHKYLIYNGPVKVRLLGHLEGDRAVPAELVDRYEDQLSLNTLTDYQSPGWAGSFAHSIGLTYLIIKFTNLMHWLLWVLHHVPPLSWSYGLCIIALTILVRGMMFPISRKQAINSMEMQEKMGKLAPELKKIKEKYKDDLQALMQAQQELYRRHGINQFAMLGGCLLLFLQMPIFLGLYYALQESIFLRLAPFFSWLAWIPNLAAPDMLFSWGQNIPFISRPEDMGSLIYLGPFFNLLPLVAVSLMLVQQKLMTPPPADEQAEMQQKMMKYMMVFMGILFYKVAAGLCVYFIASSLWGLAERKLNPRAKPGGAGAAAAAAPPKPEGKKPRPDGKKKPPANGAMQKIHDWWTGVLEQAGKQQQARKGRRRDDRAK